MNVYSPIYFELKEEEDILTVEEELLLSNPEDLSPILIVLGVLGTRIPKRRS